MMKARGKLYRVTALAAAVLLCVSMVPIGTFAESKNVDRGMTLSEGDLPVDGGEDGSSQGEDGGTQHRHSLEFVMRVDATCLKSGVEAHYVCTGNTGCGKEFFDAAGEKEVTNQEDLIIPIKEHDWDGGVADPNNSRITIYTCRSCGTTKEVEGDPQPIDPDPQPIDPQPIDPDPQPIDPDPVDPDEKFPEAKSVELNGNTLKFKSKVVTQAEQIKAMDEGRVDHVKLKAAKSKITVYWKTNKAMKFIDGVILLRKTGTAKTYKEIAVIPFRTSDGDAEEWTPKTKYVDKTAAKADTPYSYVVVSYLDKNGQRLISHCSDWAAGQTTASMLKTVNTAAISSTSEKLQYKGTVKLKLAYEKPKETYNAKSFRWYSDDKKVAKVTSKGKITAAGVGSTTIRGRLSSGDDITCKVTVVGALKPGTPKLKVDTATDTSITLTWNEVKNATEYDVYRSDDGLNWKAPVTTEKTTYKFKNLVKNHRYTFYVIARNVNYSYSKDGANSNVINQKAVQKRRATKVTGFPKKASLRSGTSYTVSVKITSPEKRKASLQMYVDKSWVTKKTIILPSGTGEKTVSIPFPNDWWGKTSSWRLYIPQSKTSAEYTSPTLKITTVRFYQNPKQYIQIKNTISKHGFDHYVAPVLINDASTRDDCVAALLKTAGKYEGDPYVSGKTQAPGKGIDAGGLVIEACYGAGIDLWPLSPSTREANIAPDIMELDLKKVTNYGTPVEGDFPEVYRGDLIFFNTSKNNVGHVAIYLGYGNIIHASKVSGKVEKVKLLTLLNKKGKYKYTIAGVRRVFA